MLWVGASSLEIAGDADEYRCFEPLVSVSVVVRVLQQLCIDFVSFLAPRIKLQRIHKKSEPYLEPCPAWILSSSLAYDRRISRMGLNFMSCILSDSFLNDYAMPPYIYPMKCTLQGLERIHYLILSSRAGQSALSHQQNSDRNQSATLAPNA